MKRFMVVLVLVALLLVTFTSVYAGGDQNNGETGEGETHEHGCEIQPCFEDAPQPKNSDYGDMPRNGKD